jgi:hypothetical protein
VKNLTETKTEMQFYMGKKMKNNQENEKGLSHSDTESEKSELPVEPKEKKAIVFNTFQEDTRPYFSSPCMLSEMEDDEDFLNR